MSEPENPEFNQHLVEPLTDQTIAWLQAARPDLTIHKDPDDWSRIHIHGDTHKYALYVRDIQAPDALE